jgi:two-component system, OmpR family, sensor histidine kinase KdpD
MPYIWSAIGVAAAVIVTGGLRAILTPLPNLSMVFLTAVLFSAVRFGMRPAILSSVLSFLAYNFFFIEPIYTFRIAEAHEVLALTIFLVVAITTSALAGRIRDQASVGAERMRATRRLYEFTDKLSGLATAEAIADGAAGEIHTSLGKATVILLADNGTLVLAGAWPPEDRLGDDEMATAHDALARNAPIGTLDGSWLFVPLRTSSGSVGAVGVAGSRLDPEARALLNTFAEQIAAAIERASFAREMGKARAEAEAERVRNTLLASISHDFRTPLASILGSATSLIEYRDKLDASAQADLLGQIKHEAEGLNEMVRNLLAITRIDAGALEVRHDWIDLTEIVERVLTATRRRGAVQALKQDLPAGLPMIRADAILVEQALTNVVNNAALHTPSKTQVTIDAAIEPSVVALRVTDDGPGIPAAILPRVFDKFVRQRGHEAARVGGHDSSGLGLAIAKGIIEAHGGSITAESPVKDGRGTRIVMTFPSAEVGK